MKAAVVNVLGQPPRYQDFRSLNRGEGEVLIQVRAAGLHPIVKALASGSHYAGTARSQWFRAWMGWARSRTGAGSTSDLRASRGERCASARWLRDRNVLPLPDGLDDVQAAAIANPGMSAWLSIKERAGLAAAKRC